MDEAIFNNPINIIEHPNLEFEETIKSLQSVIEIGNNNDDFTSLNHLNDKQFVEKFDIKDIDLFNQLKEKYLAALS
jgi:hypothetical protein